MNTSEATPLSAAADLIALGVVVLPGGRPFRTVVTTQPQEPDTLAHEMWRAVLTAVACARAWLGLGLVLLARVQARGLAQDTEDAAQVVAVRTKHEAQLQQRTVGQRIGSAGLNPITDSRAPCRAPCRVSQCGLAAGLAVRRATATAAAAGGAGAVGRNAERGAHAAAEMP